jgi:hypothetical protein
VTQTLTAAKYMNATEAAEYLRLELNTLAVWRTHKRGPRYLKCGAKVLYRIEDLDAWLASRAVEVPAAV